MILSSIFGKTKPINFILLIAYFLLVSVISTFSGWSTLSETTKFSDVLIVCFFVPASMFLVEFICKRNNLSLNNNYVIFCFITMIAVFPVLFFYPELILASWFLLLSVRKIITLKSQISVKSKIYDAALWIGIAMLFYNWSLLMLIPLYVAIAIYAGKSFKNLIIPIIALSTVLVIAFTFFMWVDQLEQLIALLSFKMFLNISHFTKPYLWLPSMVILLLITISVFTFFLKARSKKTSVKNSLLIMLITLLAVMFALVIGNKSEGASYVLICFPLAVFTGNYLELLSKKWIVEGLLWIFLLLPLLNLVLQFVAKA